MFRSHGFLRRFDGAPTVRQAEAVRDASFVKADYLDKAERL